MASECKVGPGLRFPPLPSRVIPHHLLHHLHLHRLHRHHHHCCCCCHGAAVKQSEEGGGAMLKSLDANDSDRDEYSVCLLFQTSL